jgi:protein gp37
MAENSNIAWTDHTFNPWWGCQRVGPGCDNCYAATLDKRTGGNHWDGDTLPRQTGPQGRRNVRKWQKEAEATGTRPRVFCASMADVFDNRVPQEWRDEVFQLIRETPNLDWIIVTKRIGNVAKMLPEDWGTDGYHNVCFLITVVNQDEANRDIPKLLKTPAYRRGVSVEPLLGPVTFNLDYGSWPLNALIGVTQNTVSDNYPIPSLDWVIVGAESGHGARPMDEDWVRSIRDECFAARTPFFYKQRIEGNKKVETPELDGQQWREFPRGMTAFGANSIF